MISDIINDTKKARSKKQKIEILRNNESWALKDILRGTYCDTIQFNLPGGKPPYKENQGHNAPSNLLKKHKEFITFVKGGPGDSMQKMKREKLFIILLESVEPPDAELVINMINKTPIKGVTKAVAKEAFPNLIQK
tara:strand:+ start:4571 stop:4978 length:408 start_codon:yes stop_codon:yes gene_type:complete